MIQRTLTKELRQLLREYPVVTLLGPRQAGKTTLAKNTLPDYEYVNLESPELREFAQDDPKAFLARCADKVILDEIQRVPTLLSYIQVIVDETGHGGQFVFTGSHQLQLHQAISQSLAGRTSILNLLPLTIAELGAVTSLLKVLKSTSLPGSIRVFMINSKGRHRPMATTIAPMLSEMYASLLSSRIWHCLKSSSNSLQAA